MKVCSDCKAERPVTDFHRNRASRDGRSNLCKDCAKERVKEWQENNREAYLAYRREYHAANRASINEYLRKWRSKNKKKVNK